MKLHKRNGNNLVKEGFLQVFSQILSQSFGGFPEYLLHLSSQTTESILQ